MRIPASPATRASGWARWGGWRQLGVAGGSIAIHLAAFGLIALSLGASRSEQPDRDLRSYQPMALDFVTLDLAAPEPLPVPEPEVAPEPPPRQELPPLEPPPPELPEPEPPKPEPPKVEPPPALPEPEAPKPDPPKPEPEIAPQPTPEPPRPQPEASVTPAPRTTPRPVAPEPKPAPEPPQPEPPRPEPPKPAPAAADPRKDKEDAIAAPAPAPASPSADAGGSVFLPPSTVIQPGGGPAGLRSLAYGNPCESKFGKKPKECVEDWRGRVGDMDSVMPRSKDDLKQHYADYITPCPHKVGCEGGEWISTNGTRAPRDLTSAESGGAASAGGINDLVGRLPQKPDFVDPGFGD